MHASWISRTFEKSALWFDAAPASLRGRMARLAARVALSHGKASMEEALTALFATPFVALIDAFRVDLGLGDEGIVDAVGEGALALYYSLRLQDDIVDEPESFDPSFVYAAEIFSGASVEAFARALSIGHIRAEGGEPRDHGASFWAARRAVLAELAEVSVWEIDTFRRMDIADVGARAEEHAYRLGAKLGAIAIPLVALSEARGRADAFEWIGPFVRHLGAGLQIVNDLLNARDDHAAKRLTPSLAVLYSGGRVTPQSEARRVWPILAADPALDRMVRAARSHLESAADLALTAGAPRVAEIAKGRVATLGEIKSTLFRLTLGARR